MAQEEEQQALLRAQPTEAEAVAANREEAAAGAGFPWLTLLGFAFLTFNSVLAIHRSNGDRAAIAFVVFSYIDLVLLFVCLRWYERAAPDSATRWRPKVAVWILTTLLTMVFSQKDAALMLPVLAVALLFAWNHSSSFVTNCAFGGLVGVLFSATKISGAANVAAVFLIFATAVLSMVVMMVSKMAPGIAKQ